MKGVLNERFALITLTEKEIESGNVEISPDDVFVLDKDKTVEILKVIKSDEFINGTGYVVFNPDNFESLTISSMFVNVIEE